MKYGEHDPNRPLIHGGWDGRSQSFYFYRDEMHLPRHMRTHIVKVTS
jgi:hypothetical protein